MFAEELDDPEVQLLVEAFTAEAGTASAVLRPLPRRGRRAGFKKVEVPGILDDEIIRSARKRPAHGFSIEWVWQHLVGFSPP
jgi:hypothetical protein